MKNIVVIGAGPAGLTAAYKLLSDGNGEYNVTILESSDMIGGISRTVCHNGNRMDIGGHRFFSKDKEVEDFWLKMMPLQGAPSFDDMVLGREKEMAPGGPDPESEDRVMLKRNRVSRIYYGHKFFDYPISLKPQTFINMGFNNTMKSGFSYVASTVHKLDETSLENFYINRFGKQLYSMFFEGYTEKLWGRHPSEIDASWGAQRVKGLSILAVLKDAVSKLTPGGRKEVETSLIEEFYYPKYGPGEMWETVAKEVEKIGGKILMNHNVDSISAENGKITSVSCGDEVFKADDVISSMPVKDLVEAMDFDVPKNISDIASGLPYRDFVTVGLLVDKLNLINKTDIKTLANIVPDCWIYVQDKGVKLGRIQVFNNWSPYLVDDPTRRVWIGLEYFCKENDDFWNMSEKETVDFAVKELVSMGVIDANTEIRDFHREKVKKAYPAYFDTYDHIDDVKNYIDTFGNLFCVGRNGQHRYNNMDHSMLTAFKCADAIISGSDNKKDIWNVNTESEYHEEKNEK